jgi:hypothetical protein
MTSFFRFVNKRVIYRLGIISLAHALVYATDFLIVNVTHVKTQKNSGMSKSTNTAVYFDWKTVIYIYVCGKCRTHFMLPMEKSVTFTGACVNEIIPNG